MKLFRLLGVLVIASVVKVASPAGLGRIVNGDEVSPGQYPFIVSVTLNDEHICGGFIYSQLFIVTAASCLIGKSPWDVAVVVGQNSLIQPDPGEKRLQAILFYVHPEYNSTTKFNDIALIEVSPPVQYGAYANFSYYDAVNETIPWATVVGWGAIEDGGLPSIKLRQATVSLSVQCELYGSDEYQFNTMICAGDSETDLASPCDYDQGSPLFQGNLVIGIMSKNRGCSGDFQPTIYTRLSAFYVWLGQTAGQQPIRSK